MIILVDDEDRENEGDLIISAEHLTADHINFMITFGKGLVCAPISSDIAKKLNKMPVIIHSYSQGLNKEHQLMTHYHGDDPLESSSYTTAANLWNLADYSAKDVDVAQIYDAFSPMIPFSLEAYNFCSKGQALKSINEGLISIDGDIPVNTSGGSLSEVYLHGMNLVTEAVKQIRGSAVMQVKNAKLALVTTCDATPNAAILLKGE